MSSREPALRPTEAECKILDVIWNKKTATVRDVFEDLSQRQTIGHTTVLKFMQIMTDKGLLVRDTTVRPQLYRAARPKQETQQGLLRSLLDRAFRDSPGDLVLQALSMQKSSPEEIDKIRKRLDEMESGTHG